MEFTKQLVDRWNRVPQKQKVLALAQGLQTLGWYALPDFVKERKARRLIKVGLSLGIAGTAGWLLKDSYQAVREEYAEKAAAESHLVDEDNELEQSQAEFSLPRLALTVGVAGAMIGISVFAERAFFRRGQRRASQGVKFAHTRQAIPVALLVGAIGALDE